MIHQYRAIVWGKDGTIQKSDFDLIEDAYDFAATACKPRDKVEILKGHDDGTGSLAIETGMTHTGAEAKRVAPVLRLHERLHRLHQRRRT